MKNWIIVTLAIIGICIAVVLLVYHEPIPENYGLLELKITDEPNLSVQHLYITLSEVRVHPSNNENWISIKEEPKQFDLISLIGTSDILGSNYLSPGKYTQIRLKVDSAIMVLTDGTAYNLTIPSSELKLISPFDIINGKKLVITLDFDVAKSIVESSGEYKLTPTVKVIYNNIECNESWSCTEWSECLNNVQNRNCVDTNNCGTAQNKPSLSQQCSLAECTPEERRCYDSTRYQVCLTGGSWSGLLNCPNSCSGAGICN